MNDNTAWQSRCRISIPKTLIKYLMKKIHKQIFLFFIVKNGRWACKNCNWKSIEIRHRLLLLVTNYWITQMFCLNNKMESISLSETIHIVLVRIICWPYAAPWASQLVVLIHPLIHNPVLLYGQAMAWGLPSCAVCSLPGFQQKVIYF